MDFPIAAKCSDWSPVRESGWINSTRCRPSFSLLSSAPATGIVSSSDQRTLFTFHDVESSLDLEFLALTDGDSPRREKATCHDGKDIRRSISPIQSTHVVAHRISTAPLVPSCRTRSTTDFAHRSRYSPTGKWALPERGASCHPGRGTLRTPSTSSSHTGTPDPDAVIQLSPIVDASTASQPQPKSSLSIPTENGRFLWHLNLLPCR